MHNIVTKGRAGLRPVPQLWLAALVCLSVICLAQFHLLAFQAPGLRAVIETGIMFCALAAACLFGLSFGHRRDLRNLLLAGALLELAVIDFVSYVLPPAIDLGSTGYLTTAPVLGGLVMATTIVVAASIGESRQVHQGRGPLVVMAAASLGAAGIAELGGFLLRSQLATGIDIDDHGLSAGLHHPIGSVLALATAGLLFVAVMRTTATGHGSYSVTVLLGAGIILFAGASLNYLVLPTPGMDWVTAGDGVRIVSYGLILAAAVRQEGAIRRAIAAAAAAEERRRIARDLHDGLAQDLAFIVAHGDRMASEAGEDHPLVIAARRALAVSRGAIADLSAAEAPSTNAALRQVADELEVRFGVRVSVNADATELDQGAREDVVRIVREAIVNAARAGARNVVVSLERNGKCSALRVLDDGAGIDADLGSRPGFGVRAMRQRAASLGGGLAARPAEGGGTELEVVFR